MQTCGERLLLKIAQTSKTSSPEPATPTSGHTAEPSSQLPPPQACSPHLVEHVRHVLLTAGLLGVAQLRCVSAGQQTLVSDQRHALVRDLVPLEVDLVVGTTWKRRGQLKTPRQSDLPSVTQRGSTQWVRFNVMVLLRAKNGEKKIPVLLHGESPLYSPFI